jgi:uncharacterized cupredoxin-like copper-binding protein
VESEREGEQSFEENIKMKRRLLLQGVLVWSVLLLTACGGSTISSGTSSVQVTETDFHIASSVMTFRPGTSYHFEVTNNGKTTHEFMIMPKAEGNTRGMPMDDMDKLALAMIESIPPGETKTLDYTFSSSATGTHPEFACYFPGHYEAGMKLDVTVQA